jgi:sugar phosphate isomerase/epimerase
MKIGVVTACWVFRLSEYDASTPWGEAQGRFEKQWSPEALDRLLGEIKEMGFDWVELWRATTGFERWDDDQLGAVRDSLARHEVTLASYCVGGIEPDSDIEGLFTYGKKLGAPMCTGALSSEDLETTAPRLARVAEKLDMSYGIENHGPGTVADPDEILKLAARYPGRIGACPDTGIYYRGGDDPLAAVEAVKDITIHTHLKDIDETGSCGVGEGELPMADIIRTLRDAGYEGVYSVEREGQGDPAALLRRSATFIREALAS